MRVLHVSRRYAPEIIGGYEFNCQRFAEEWVLRGHAVAVLTRPARDPVEAGDVTVFRTLVDLPPGVHPGPLPARVYQARLALANRLNRRRTRRILASWRPDVVVFWAMNTGILAPVLAARDLGIPYAFDLGDHWLVESLETFAAPDPWRRRFRRWLLGGPFDASMVRAAIVHSEFMRKYYAAAGIAEDAIEVIPRGVEDEFFRVGERRTEPGGQEAKVRIACVGRLVPDKGALQLAAAFQRAQAVNPELELHFYGEGYPWYREQLETWSRERGLLGRALFVHGPVPRQRMPEVYAANHILGFPVLWEEPSSNVLLEAMAAGLPIVATDTGSNGEFVREGITGLLVERENEEALARALLQLARDPDSRRRMGVAGRSRVAAQHRLRDVFDRTEAKLLSIAGAVAPPAFPRPHRRCP